MSELGVRFMSTDIGVGQRAEARAKESADVYDFVSKQLESSRVRRVKDFRAENAMLRRTASEIQMEIVRLRDALRRCRT